jgi:hypothetical protein
MVDLQNYFVNQRRRYTAVLLEQVNGHNHPEKASGNDDDDDNPNTEPASISTGPAVVAASSTASSISTPDIVNDTPKESLSSSSFTRNTTTRTPRERRPPFPSRSYPLLKDEEELKHNFISFIDQSMFQTYSQTVRLVEPRGYAIPDPFLTRNFPVPPTVDDVAMPKSNYGPLAKMFAWNGLPARAVVGGMAYMAFPYIIGFLQRAAMADHTMVPSELSQLVDAFLPGVAIVLGTYYSLTLSILYDRFAKLQESVNLEAALLAMTMVNLLNLFEDDQAAAVEGAQCIADQVRTMVFDSRGKETMQVIYSDPYARILRLLKDYDKDVARDAYLLGDIHSAVVELYRVRSKRMSYEALALAPTHFDVMTFLSGLLLTGYTLGTVATAQTGVPSETARILFAALFVCYTIFYEMAFDLNRPFDGIYQIRRSGSAMHLLFIKQLVANHPLLAGQVDFEEIVDDDSSFIPECDDACQQRKNSIWYN